MPLRQRCAWINEASCWRFPASASRKRCPSRTSGVPLGGNTFSRSALSTRSSATMRSPLSLRRASSSLFFLSNTSLFFIYSASSNSMRSIRCKTSRSTRPSSSSNNRFSEVTSSSVERTERNLSSTSAVSPAKRSSMAWRAISAISGTDSESMLRTPQLSGIWLSAARVPRRTLQVNGSSCFCLSSSGDSSNSATA